MLRIFLLCIALTSCADPGPRFPVVTQVTWSHVLPPEKDLSELPKIETLVDGSATLASVWGATYLYQDLSKAKGWLQLEGSTYVLCFYAQEHMYGPNDGMPSGARPTLFVFRIQGLPPQAKLKFRERCVPGANNSFKPKPLRSDKNMAENRAMFLPPLRGSA